MKKRVLSKVIMLGAVSVFGVLLFGGCSPAQVGGVSIFSVQIFSVRFRSVFTLWAKYSNWSFVIL